MLEVCTATRPKKESLVAVTRTRVTCLPVSCLCHRYCDDRVDVYPSLLPLVSETLFRTWFFNSIGLRDAFLEVWEALGCFSCNYATLTAPYVEACQDLFVPADGHFGPLQVRFMRAVLVPFLIRSSDRLADEDPRMRVWNRLADSPYFLFLLFANASDFELSLLFKNDRMGSGARVWCIIRPMLAQPALLPGTAELALAVRLMRLDPFPGNIGLCVRFIRLAEGADVCKASLELLLQEMLFSADTADSITFWKQLVYNAAVFFDGVNATGVNMSAPWYIFCAVLRVFSTRVQHLCLFRSAILEDGPISSYLERAGLLGDMYSILFTAYVGHKTPCEAWRAMFPDGVAACRMLGRGNVASALARRAAGVINAGEQVSLLAAMAATIGNAPDIFGVRSACVQKMLRPCYPHTSTMLRACADLVTPEELARGRLGMELVSAAVENTRAALRRVWECSAFEPGPLPYNGAVFHVFSRDEALNIEMPLAAVPFRGQMRRMLHEVVEAAGELKEVWIIMRRDWLASAVAYDDVLHALAERGMPRRWIEDNLVDPAVAFPSETVECLATHKDSLRMLWIGSCVQQSRIPEIVIKKDRQQRRCV